jgi:hypothetical protein
MVAHHLVEHALARLTRDVAARRSGHAAGECRRRTGVRGPSSRPNHAIARTGARILPRRRHPAVAFPARCDQFSGLHEAQQPCGVAGGRLGKFRERRPGSRPFAECTKFNTSSRRPATRPIHRIA